LLENVECINGSSVDYPISSIRVPARMPTENSQQDKRMRRGETDSAFGGWEMRGRRGRMSWQ